MGFSPADQIEQMLAFGQYWDAYQNCNKLIQQSGKHADTNLYRLRASAEIHLGMNKEAIDDANYIITHSNDRQEKTNAYHIRMNAYVKSGNYDEAYKDCSSYGDRKTLSQLNQLRSEVQKAVEAYNAKNYDAAISGLDLAVQNSPKCVKYVQMLSNILFDRGDFGRFQSITDPIKEELANDAIFNYKRGIVSMCQNNMNDAIKYLQASSKMRGAPQNASIALTQTRELSNLFNSAQQILQRSLNSNSKTKISDKEASIAEKTVQKLREQGSAFCPAGSEIMQKATLIEAKLLRAKGDLEGALKILDKAFEGSQGSVELHTERGEINFELKNWDQAIFDLQIVAQSNNNRHIQELLNKAQAEKKKADHVNYYAELGVDEKATHEEIIAAYKKCVRKYHPDQYSDKQKKAEAEEKMKRVNIAYDIIGDEQKRRNYDMGDPEYSDGFNGFQEGGFSDVNEIFKMFGFPFGGEGTGFQHFEFAGGNGFQFHVQFG